MISASSSWLVASTGGTMPRAVFCPAPTASRTIQLRLANPVSIINCRISLVSGRSMIGASVSLNIRCTRQPHIVDLDNKEVRIVVKCRHTSVIPGRLASHAFAARTAISHSYSSQLPQISIHLRTLHLPLTLPVARRIPRSSTSDELVPTDQDFQCFLDTSRAVS